MSGSAPGTGVPVGCGALGRFDDAAVARVAAGLGAGVAEVDREDRAVLFLDREPSRWQATDGSASGLAWPERLPDRSPAANSWREAASAGACGLYSDATGPAIHASSSGLGNVYWVHSGDAIYFATRIDALARAGLCSLSPDWQAWSELFALSFPIAGGTPFSEIRRLERGASVGLDGNGAVREQAGSLAWADGRLVSREEAAERVIASLRADVAALESEGPITCLLTGGFDSRLVAAGLAERDIVATSHTGDSDFGDEVEERYAASVAKHLGIGHSYIGGDRRPFAAEFAAAADRVEYQSLPHLPMTRLAAALPGAGICTDGIGGNLLKGRYLREDLLAADDPIDAALGSWMPERLPVVFDSGAWDAIRARTRASFLAAGERFRGHPMETVLATQVRVIRCIGTAPISIVGEDNRIFMPLVADEVAGAGLSAPPEQRRDRSFYRYVLDTISPGLGRLPSTNDGDERERQRRPRLRMPDAREAHRELLLASPLRPWFTPTFVEWIEQGRMARIDKRRRRITRIQAICMFTLWCERYRDLVGEPDPGELFR